MQRPLAHEAEGGGVPEGRGAAVAERHLVVRGKAEEVGEAAADAGDDGLDRRLAVGGPHDPDAVGRELLELLGADLRGPAAEAAVGGEEVFGYLHHGSDRVYLVIRGGGVAVPTTDHTPVPHP